MLYYFLFKRTLKSKSFIVFIFSLMLLSSRIVYNMIDRNDSEILYVIFNYIIHEYILLFLIIPFFLMLNNIITDLLDKSIIILKFSHSKVWWKKKMISISIFTVIFSFLMHLSVLITIYLSGHILKIDIDFVIFLFYSMFIQILGFVIIALSYHIIMLKYQLAFMGIIIPLAILAVLDRIKFIFSLHPQAFTTLTEFMTMLHILSLDRTILIAQDIIPLSGLLLLAFGLYLLGVHIINKKDFYWR